MTSESSPLMTSCQRVAYKFLEKKSIFVHFLISFRDITQVPAHLPLAPTPVPQSCKWEKWEWRRTQTLWWRCGCCAWWPRDGSRSTARDSRPSGRDPTNSPTSRWLKLVDYKWLSLISRWLKFVMYTLLQIFTFSYVCLGINHISPYVIIFKFCQRGLRSININNIKN